MKTIFLPSRPLDNSETIRRKVTAAEVIFEEIEILNKACFEQGHIPKEWFDDLQSFVTENRRNLKIQHSTYVEYGDYETILARACLVYALLNDELTGKNKDASRGWKIKDSAQKGHESVHGSQQDKQSRFETYRLEFNNLHAANPHRSKEWCYARIAKKFDVSAKTIKRHTSPK